MLKTLQKNIFKEITGIFLLCLSAFLLLLLVGRLLQLRSFLVGQNISIFNLGELFLYLTPFFLLMLIPVCCMLGTFLTFLRMGTDREIVALRAGGLSLFKFFSAPIFFSIIGFLVTLFISFYGVSWGIERFKNTLLEIAKTQVELKLEPGRFNNNFPGVTIFARSSDVTTHKLKDIFVQNTVKKDKASIFASTGSIYADYNTKTLIFELKNGTIYRYINDELSVLNFINYRLSLDVSDLIGDFHNSKTALKDMSWEQLNQEKNKQNINTQDLTKIILEQQKRIALPAACFILTLFVIPLAFLFQGMQRQYGIIIALAFFLIYYTMVSFGISLGEFGSVPPIIAPWIANILFFILAIFGIIWAKKEQEIQFKFTKKIKKMIKLIFIRKNKCAI